MPPTLRNEMAELLADIINSLVLSKLERMVDRMRGSSLRRGEPRAIAELGSIGDCLARLLAPLKETVLRVGPLELDLIDRTAKRGDRHIDLRPREFQLLKYMMQRSDKVLTRAALLKEVWHHKFAPETNLVDVQIGLLRRRIDGANEAPMIRNVRGVGFVLDASPLLAEFTDNSGHAINASADGQCPAARKKPIAQFTGNPARARAALGFRRKSAEAERAPRQEVHHLPLLSCKLLGTETWVSFDSR
jgi:DNA-binding winged helix-turn-helix (wHTH) protein